MFRDYQSLVLDAYEKKKAANTLSQLLVYPSPANIREECIAVCNERYRTKDDKVLRTFFGKQDNQAAYLEVIYSYKIDKFKPLVNLLKKQIANPDEKNIELLAWLIDFEPRPFQFGKQYDISSLGINPVARNGEERKDEHQEVEELMPVVLPEQQVEKKNITVVNMPLGVMQTDNHTRRSATTLKIKPLIILPVIAVLIGGIYWFSNRNTSGCMTWKGDHYEQVPCDSKFGDTLVVGIDTFKLNHFKKITRPDTITGYSIGSVWYAKVDGGIEFYTASGSHPVQQQKQLKPITDYIIIKYIRKDDSLLQVKN